MRRPKSFGEVQRSDRRCAIDGAGIDELRGHVVAHLGVEETADWIAELAVADIAPADFAVVAVVDWARPASDLVAATDPLALHLYEVERALNDGPGVDALRTGTAGHITDTRQPDGTHRTVTVACALQGVMSVVAVPLTAADERSGWIALYSESAESFTGVHTARATDFAAAAGVVLANAIAYWNIRSQADSLAVALESRGVIDQAKGILMNAQLCTPERAFRVLVEQSQFEQRKLRDVAHDLVERTGRNANA